MKTILILLTLTLTSCASPKRTTVRKVYKPTVIQNLANCTRGYISELGVKPAIAINICEKIYRRKE